MPTKHHTAITIPFFLSTIAPTFLRCAYCPSVYDTTTTTTTTTTMKSLQVPVLHPPRPLRLPLFFLFLAVTWLGLVTPCHALAASKKKTPKRTTTAASDKGFGAKAPTFAEILSGFRTRLPDRAADTPCPCGSQSQSLSYADCCQPYHAGARTAETPLRVLQSRYTAFCYRVIPYIMLTTHDTCQYWRADRVAWAKELDRDGSLDTFDFLGLTVVGETAGETADRAHIDFRVHVRNKRDSEETVLKEKSLFLRQGDRWFYASGEAKPEPVLKKKTEGTSS